MPVTKPTNLPSRRGESDARNYKQRVKRQITKHLREKIGEEDIVTSEGGKIKVPVKGSKRYRFILDRNLPEGMSGDGGGEGSAGTDPGEEMYEVWLDMAEVEEMLFAELDLPRLKPKQEQIEVTDYKFDTYAIKGPQLDKRATLRRNLLRNSAQGEPKIGDFDKDDLRYISYHDKPRPKSKAVVFLMMDVSGSMSTFHKLIARLFFYWIVRFLRYRYDAVAIHFIAHTTDAKEMAEHEFFNRVESGGTMVSSAYKLAYQMQQTNYPQNDWNVYVLHASDGDNWQLDNDDVRASITKLCKIASLVGYLEIRPSIWTNKGYMPPTWSTLLDDLEQHRSTLGEEFMATSISEERDIWPALKLFFAKEAVEDSVIA